MNAETDFGPLVSFELNSLLPSSLGRVSMWSRYSINCKHTLKSRLTVGGSHIVQQGCAGIQPWAPRDAQNTSNSVRSKSERL